LFLWRPTCRASAPARLSARRSPVTQVRRTRGGQEKGNQEEDRQEEGGQEEEDQEEGGQKEEEGRPEEEVGRAGGARLTGGNDRFKLPLCPDEKGTPRILPGRFCFLPRAILRGWQPPVSNQRSAQRQRNQRPSIPKEVRAAPTGLFCSAPPAP
jgi:hypothetical protein